MAIPNVVVYCLNTAGNKTQVNALRKSGFISVPFIKGSWFCLYSITPDISKKSLRDFQNWLVQLGDSDIV